MRVKKFQRELEAAESRAEEAESSLNAFRSQQRVFAAAAESRSQRAEVADVEREVVVKKTVTNVNKSNVNSSSSQNIVSSNQLQSSSNAAAAAAYSSSQNYRAGSTMAYSRAGSMSRASMSRGASVGRASSMLRY